MKLLLTLLRLHLSNLRGDGTIYVMAILGSVAAISYLLAGGILPNIEKNPVNPEYVQLADTSINADRDSLQLVNIEAVPTSTITHSPTPTFTGPTFTPTPTLTQEQCFAQSAVAIVVDTSGSMSAVDPGQTETRIGRLKDALTEFLTFFRPDAAISLIEFANIGRVLVPIGKLSQNEGALNTAIDNILNDDKGSTNMKEGLEKAVSELEAAKSTYPNYSQFTVFMSDGLPESGDCKYRQYTIPPTYDTGPYHFYQSGDPKKTGIVPPFCVLPETNEEPTFFTHKWSPILPGRVIKRTGKLFSLSMRVEPDTSDPDYEYEKATYDKTGSLMSNLASDPESRYYISSPTTESLTATYQEIARRICP